MTSRAVARLRAQAPPRPWWMRIPIIGMSDREWRALYASTAIRGMTARGWLSVNEIRGD